MCLPPYLEMNLFNTRHQTSLMCKVIVSCVCVLCVCGVCVCVCVCVSVCVWCACVCVSVCVSVCVVSSHPGFQSPNCSSLTFLCF